jgi:large subunit ribosomal protein L10
MDNPRPEKVAIVTEVRERITGSAAALLTEYRGLSVKDLQNLRSQLTTAGAELKIYKNTLVRFAAHDLGIETLDPMLEGPTAIAFAKLDAAAAAKVLRDFARTNPLLVVKGGLLDDKVVDADATKALADLPSRDVLLSQIAGLFAAPMSQMASLLEALPKSFAYGVQALIEKGGAAPVAAAPEPEPEPEPEPAPEPAAEITETPEETPAAETAEEGEQ